MKNIKKSIMLATALFVSTAAMANEDKYDYKEAKQHKQTMQEKGKGYKGFKNKKDRRSQDGDVSRFFIGTVYSLNLTRDQEMKIDKTIQEFKNKKFDKFNGFTKDGFDKQKFIEARKNAKEDKIKLKADLIEKIYKILSKDQILQMNKEIEMFKKMKEVEMYKKMKRHGAKSGKHCNDRG